MIQAKIVADSCNEFGHRLTTMVVTFPRFILAELNTHRMFSRNSASSRAIPFHKMLDSVRNNPFIPMAWQKDHKGMQGTEYIDADEFFPAIKWLDARDMAITQAIKLNELGVTKQLCNRLLEPFMWHTVIVTATEWENFFSLRCPRYELEKKSDPGIQKSFRSKKNAKLEMSEEYSSKLTDLDWLKINKGQAEIHMMALAEAMWDAYQESTPKSLEAGQWHIPFSERLKLDGWETNDILTKMVKISTAMCARVSYTVVGEEGREPNYEDDIKLHDYLAGSGHWSPFEHIACCMSEREINNNKIVVGDEDSWITESLGWSGNFRGFTQYRKTFSNENITNIRE